MQTEPVQLDRRQGAAAQAYRVMRERIVTGALRPGDALSEPKMALMFGVSRTPVREVFKRLADEGLLEIWPQVGTYVARIDIDRVRDDQFVRETLESRTVELAAARVAGDGAARAELAAALDRQNDLVEHGDALGFFDADDDFHALIIRLSGHAEVWRTVQATKVQLDRVRHLSLEDGGWLRMVFDEHRTIAEALASGDGPRAVAAMRSHLRSVFAAIERIAGDHPDFFGRVEGR